MTTHAYIAARRAVFDPPPPLARAVVLVPERALLMWPWQGGGIIALSGDFTRNGIGADAPVLQAGRTCPMRWRGPAGSAGARCFCGSRRVVWRRRRARERDETDPARSCGGPGWR